MFSFEAIFQAHSSKLKMLALHLLPFSCVGMHTAPFLMEAQALQGLLSW